MTQDDQTAAKIDNEVHEGVFGTEESREAPEGGEQNQGKRQR
jgi:hypothetical protein